MAHWHIPKNQKTKSQANTAKPTLIPESELTKLSDIDLISTAYHSWDIKHCSEQFDKSYLLNWRPAHLLLQLISQNTIEHQDITYQAVYYRGHSSNDFSIAKKACVSFRYCKRLDIAVAMIKFIF